MGKTDPSSVETEQVLVELGRFDPKRDVNSSRTPPTSWYTDDAFYRREQQALFHTSWQIVGRSAQLEHAGDFITGELGADPVVIVNHEGVLRGFHNVCRHHAACIANGEGHTHALTCPYHGWRYGLDGRLQSAPRMAGMQGFDRDALSLPEIDVENWGPYVFARAVRGGRAVAEWLAPLTAALDKTGWRTLRYHSTRTYRLQCNWKVYVDNYLDGGYHIAHAHHGLAAQLDLDAYQTTLFDAFSVQQTVAASGDAAKSASADAGIDFEARIGDGALYAWLFPNFMLNRYGPMLDTNLVIARGPHECDVVYDFFFDHDTTEVDSEFIARSLEASDRVQQEDVELCKNVQRGLRSSSYDKGWYAPRVEHGMHQFHCLLHNALTGTPR